MKGLTRKATARGLLPYVATILSISLAVTLRVEHACSDSSVPATLESPHTLYPYTEMISGIELSGTMTIPRISLESLRDAGDNERDR